VKLGQELGKDYEVYMPLMFGEPGQDSNSLGNRQACKAELFKCSDRNATHPILKPLLEMTGRICGGTECGVIGMCLTGTVPLSLMRADGVVALVMAQPTLPFLHFWPFVSLDISAADTAAAMAIAVKRHASIYLTRSRHDLISGHAAFNLLVRRIKPFAAQLSHFEHHEVPGHHHSTLVREGKSTAEADAQLRAVKAALDVRLRPKPKRVAIARRVTAVNPTDPAGRPGSASGPG
jgi:dienelactone hydrolase